jgi:pyrroline-5-carboxylate reductase
MKLGVIGCGKMGSALLKGAINSGAVEAADVHVHDAFAECAEKLAADTGATAAGSNAAVVQNSEAVLLCTKPQDLLDMIRLLPPLGGGHLFISIAAGMPLAKLEDALGEDVRAIRVMPNTPALIGKGASAFARGNCATEADAEFVAALLGSVGSVVEVPEKLLDAVTGLSGSGPAYVYTVIEALADGGVLAGIPKDKALQLAAQTVAGAAEMVLQSDEHPATLRDQVTSPGGTTIAGLAEIEAGGLRSTLIEAVRAATERAEELGQG